MEHPDFEVKFHSFNGKDCDSWGNVEVCDVGHSEGTIVLSGDLE